MEEQQSTVSILVIWREKKMNVEMNSSATLKEFGHKLQKLTNVKADTMRLLVPQASDKSSQLLTPFSDKHSSLSLQESSIFEGKSIRMMGVFQDEIDQVSQNAKADLRIAGFDEEERRLRQRMLNGPQPSLKLPQGAYIFCDFRTLNIPGMELNPPASEALRRMHMLAADPGIVAIMNKHRWQVGIMTEMAPVGYVGISPKCILGFNKNHGEEISLRLRTDDLKGFRKYASIKKTLLHELAHMVHSEHDANFYALDKQLNQEADSLDWTRSKGHTLSGVRRSERYEEFFVGTSGSSSQKLGGRTSDHLASARSSSVAAAYRRLENASTNNVERIEVHVAPDPDDSGFEIHGEPDPDDSVVKEDMQLENLKIAHSNPNFEPDPDDYSGDHIKFEPDSDDSQRGDAMDYEPCSGINGNRIKSESYLGDCEMAQCVPYLTTDEKLMDPKTFEDSDPYKYATVAEPDPDDSLTKKTVAEPDPDDSEVKGVILEYGNSDEPDPDDSPAIETVEDETPVRKTSEESDPDDSEVKGTILDCGNTAEPGPDDSRANTIMYTEPACNDDVRSNREGSRLQADEPDPDDQELQRIQDPVRIVSLRLQKAIEMLQSEVNHIEALSVLQTLFKIIRNVIEHPDEIKFRRLRKANPLFQRNVANYKAAIEFLFLVGFIEEVVSNETYVVLKRNDPGLLWLAKSSLEMCIAC